MLICRSNISHYILCVFGYIPKIKHFMVQCGGPGWRATLTVSSRAWRRSTGSSVRRRQTTWQQVRPGVAHHRNHFLICSLQIICSSIIFGLASSLDDKKKEIMTLFAACTKSDVTLNNYITRSKCPFWIINNWPMHAIRTTSNSHDLFGTFSLVYKLSCVNTLYQYYHLLAYLKVYRTVIPLRFFCQMPRLEEHQATVGLQREGQVWGRQGEEQGIWDWWLRG